MNTGDSGSMISSNGEIKKDKHCATSASRSCPICSHELNYYLKNLDGVPARLRFNPSDEELIPHLESMVKDGGSRAHPLINHFIRTIQGEDGICYTHPENLPGVTRDGLSNHFFHMPSNAYLSGTMKRRKIMSEHGQRSLHIMQFVPPMHHQQQRQAHGHGMFVPTKMVREVGVGDPILGDQEQVNGNHHIPSQHDVQLVHTEPDTTLSLAFGADLNTESTKVSPPAVQQHHVELDTTLSLAFGTALNTESTKVSHAVQHASPLLNSGFHSKAILLQNEKQQQKQQQRDDCIRSYCLGEAMIACQTASIEEDDASTQPKEI